MAQPTLSSIMAICKYTFTVILKVIFVISYNMEQLHSWNVSQHRSSPSKSNHFKI